MNHSVSCSEAPAHSRNGSICATKALHSRRPNRSTNLVCTCSDCLPPFVRTRYLRALGFQQRTKSSLTFASTATSFEVHVGPKDQQSASVHRWAQRRSQEPSVVLPSACELRSKLVFDVNANREFLTARTATKLPPETQDAHATHHARRRAGPPAWRGARGRSTRSTQPRQGARVEPQT